MKLRLDKFVWFVRLAKTRSIAVTAIEKGKIKLNGSKTKPSKEVKIGDHIQVHRHSSIFTYQIKDLLTKRVGAKLVDDYIINTTTEEELKKHELYKASQRTYKSYGAGKPTKKDRRDIEKFIDDWD